MDATRVWPGGPDDRLDPGIAHVAASRVGILSCPDGTLHELVWPLPHAPFFSRMELGQLPCPLSSLADRAPVTALMFDLSRRKGLTVS